MNDHSHSGGLKLLPRLRWSAKKSKLPSHLDSLGNLTVMHVCLRELLRLSVRYSDNLEEYQLWCLAGAKKLQDLKLHRVGA
jgi:hypothetical protein